MKTALVWRRKHCSLAVIRRSQKCFAPPQTPFPGAQDGQNLISWRRSLPLPTDPVWWGSMHAISSYRGNRPPHTQTHTLRAQQFGILCLTVCVVQLLGLISFDVTWKRICLCDIASRLAHWRCFRVMRYTNRHFTYLLTYLHTPTNKQTNKQDR